jgi:GTPase involved in cell partitioning and DNA repair
MPVEIKELHIRVAVSGQAPKGAAKPAKDAHGKGGGDHGGGGGDKDAIVAECVEQVLQILQAKKER